jgi:hypothetical protein
MSNLVTADYQGNVVAFTDDGWFHATAVAERFEKKRVNDFLVLPSTIEYVAALDDAEIANTGKSGIWVKAKRGHNGGTWLHPDLAVSFARWLDTRFAIWCDRQIRSILSGAHPHNDWKRLRHEAASSYKVMTHVLQLTRKNQGKTSAAHHYINEAKLINGVLTGEFKGLNRDKLPEERLGLLAALEAYNTVQIAFGKDYAARKELLFTFAVEWRQSHAPKLPGPQAA